MRGSLQQVKNRRGELVWRAQWREDGRGRSRILGTCQEMGRAEAKVELKAIVEALPDGRLPSSAPLTLKQFIRDEYLIAKSATWKLSTERTTTALIERYIVPALGDRVLVEVVRQNLQELLNSIALRLSKAVVKHVRFQLQAIFDLAEGDGKLKFNPTKGLDLPRAGRKRVPPMIADQAKVSAAMMKLDMRDRLFVDFCYWRGMRPGEVAALKIGDVLGDSITVERRVYMGIVDDPKSDLGTRPIPIEMMRDRIDAYIAILPNRRPEAWLFPSETGKTPISPKNLYQKRLEPVFKSVGLNRFNFQSMRASFNNKLHEVEPDAKVRADIMGHTPDVNEQVYRQSTTEQRKRSIRKLDEGRPQ